MQLVTEAQPRSLHVAEGRSATKPEGTLYSVDTKINQSDWLRKLIFKALLFLTGH